jgi:hypothetical protein
MKNAAQVMETFDNIRRAQRAGVYAPHKPLLILLALARVQPDEARLRVALRAMLTSRSWNSGRTRRLAGGSGK